MGYTMWDCGILKKKEEVEHGKIKNVSPADVKTCKHHTM